MVVAPRFGRWVWVTAWSHYQMHPSFWSAFEEPSICGSPSNAAQTQTRQREEPDQRADKTAHSAFLHMATKTAQREHEQEHRFSQARFGAATSWSPGASSETMTATREEKDPHRSYFAALPQPIAAGTRTLTETREESDQDQSIRGHHAIPTTDSRTG